MYPIPIRLLGVYGDNFNFTLFTLKNMQVLVFHFSKLRQTFLLAQSNIED
jgi:hypothetical protein